MSRVGDSFTGWRVVRRQVISDVAPSKFHFDFLVQNTSTKVEARFKLAVLYILKLFILVSSRSRLILQ